MDSAEVSQPNGAHKDEESPSWLALQEDDKMQVTEDLLCLQEAVWELFEDCEKKLRTTRLTADLHRERIRESFYHLHQHLLKEEETRLAKHQSRVEKSIVVLETRVLSLAALSTSITELQVKLINKEQITVASEQLKVLRAQLHDISKFFVPLERNISPFQIQEWRGIRHVVKPMQKSLHFGPGSAHPNLFISKNLKQVRYTSFPKVQKGKNCFEPGLYVLGLPGFQCGQHYWEVDVGHKSNWILGVVKMSVKRKEHQDLCPANGFWVLCKKDTAYYGCGHLAPQPTTLPMRIGVFVDILSGNLAFYNVDTTSLIFEMSKCTFVEKLFAFFGPGVPVREEDLRPMTLLPPIRS
ncbi:E3 ubiquitin-protein ligase TRIM39-like isoform X3 [Pseudophryne corroboree]|uniref:E3 ubiquitin-protein ligase TRIM39-like isoform X3 n=1 Tax=Pseudophryne corroboree TaxID=495146 RepID=UPI003081EBBB